MTTVGLVDDQALFTSGMSMVLSSQPDLEVAWRALDGEQSLAEQEKRPVDLVLMDVQMPVMDGITATRLLLERWPETKVVILTTFDTEEYVLDGLGAGASGFLLKDTPPEELLTAVRTVASGESVISPRSTRRLVERVRPMFETGADQPAPAQRTEALDSLTPREIEILTAVAKGWSNTEICERMVLSMPTVKTHISHVLAKTGSRDRVQAVLFAFRCGLVSRGDLLADPH